MRTQTATAATRRTWVDRAGALSGAAYVVLIIVGNQITSGSQTDPHPSGRQDLADFSRTPTVAENIGFAMEVLGFLTFMFFIGWLVTSLRRRGGPAEWLAGVVGIAGATNLIVKLASVMPMMAGEMNHDKISPTTARVLADMNGAAFVVSFLPFGVFLLSAGLAILASGWMGRVAGWSAVVIGTAGVALPLASRLDPVNTNPVPFMLGLLWVLVVGIRLGWRGPRAVRESLEPTPVPALS